MGKELVTPDQMAELVGLVTRPYTEYGLTKEEWQRIREDPAHKLVIAAHYDFMRRIEARRNPLGASLPLNTLEGLSHAPANTSLFFNWDGRLDETARYARITTHFSQLGINDFELIESGPQHVPGWPEILAVSPVDLAHCLGVDIIGPEAKHAKVYCDLARSLTRKIDGLRLGDYLDGCLKGGGARLETNCAEQWSQLSQPQVKGQPLKVRRMPVNPAAWFGFDGVQYSIAPRDVRSLANQLPGGSQIRSVACGDLVTFVSLVVGEPHLLGQIAKGTCPRIDIPGTELRSGRGWPACPGCHQDDEEAWLDDVHVDNADDHFGSLLCAVE